MTFVKRSSQISKPFSRARPQFVSASSALKGYESKSVKEARKSLALLRSASPFILLAFLALLAIFRSSSPYDEALPENREHLRRRDNGVDDVIKEGLSRDLPLQVLHENDNKQNLGRAIFEEDESLLQESVTSMEWEQDEEDIIENEDLPSDDSLQSREETIDADSPVLSDHDFYDTVKKISEGTLGENDSNGEVANFSDDGLAIFDTTTPFPVEHENHRNNDQHDENKEESTKQEESDTNQISIREQMHTRSLEAKQLVVEKLKEEYANYALPQNPRYRVLPQRLENVNLSCAQEDAFVGIPVDGLYSVKGDGGKHAHHGWIPPGGSPIESLRKWDFEYNTAMRKIKGMTEGGDMLREFAKTEVRHLRGLRHDLFCRDD